MWIVDSGGYHENDENIIISIEVIKYNILIKVYCLTRIAQNSVDSISCSISVGCVSRNMQKGQMGPNLDLNPVVAKITRTEILDL